MEDFCPRAEAWDGARFLYATVHEGASAQETAHNCQHCADFGRMKDGRDMTLSFMAETPLFSGLPESVRASLAFELGVQFKVYKANELVVHECEPATWIVCILSGRVHVYECGFCDDSRHLVRTLCYGDVYGASFPLEVPHFFDVKNNGIPVNKG